MPQHLLGGGHIFAETGSYAHDVLLDTYDEAGVFALVAAIAIVWDAASKMRKMLRNTLAGYNLKITVLCIYAAIFIEFAVEPIIAGMPWLLMIFCFTNGMVTAYVKGLQKNA